MSEHSLKVPMIEIIGEGTMQANEAIHGILRFMKHEGPEDFDTTFLDDLHEQVEAGRELTHKQKRAVNRIVSAYRIDGVLSWAHS